MVTLPSIVCPRCGRHNLSRARFCAQCGLNLAVTGVGEWERPARGRGRKNRGGVVLFLILLGLFLAAMGALFRHRTCSRQPPLPRFIVQPVPRQGVPWMGHPGGELKQSEGHSRHSEWEVER